MDSLNDGLDDTLRAATDLSLEAVRTGLTTRIIGRNIIYHASLASTMDAARKAAGEGAPDGTVVIAGEQTSGRGRIKRTWVSPPGNIALSIVLYPPPGWLPYLVMATSVGVARCVRATTGLTAAIKWPNDVLLNGRKVSGILIESRLSGARVEYAIVGIGLNVNLRTADYPEIAPFATSLSDEAGRALPLPGVVRTLLTEIDALYGQLPAARTLFEEWRDNLITIGKTVRASWGTTAMEGVAEAVAEDGSLLLRGADGTLHRIVAGDVTLRQ